MRTQLHPRVGDGLKRAALGTAGFTLIELMTTVVIIGMALLIMMPRLRVSPRSHVRHAAEQLVNDLELIRTRALSTKSMVRLDCNTGGASYIAYLDDNQDDVINATTAEAQAMKGFGQRSLANGVVFGLGSVPRIPGDTLSGPVTFASDQILFSNRGLPQPFGVRGTVYFTHPDDNTIASAVTVTGSGSFRTWNYYGGGWQ